MGNTNVYKANGYLNREDYLQTLAENYGLSLSEVLIVADVLGENEDFDGLITALEDLED